jgi:NAD(P)-dependent dehydrogenase (short-subunit alcohol dehydrogenase family)
MAWLTPFNNPLTEWRGRSVWLVGASSGIGLACAKALHAQGAKVCVSARQEALLQAFVSEHPGSMALALDVTDAQAVQAAARIVENHQGLDVVMYCAGVYHPLRATDYKLAVMEQHMAVNYHGALYVLDAVLPALLAQGHGHLSLVSSVAGYRGLPQSLAYGPSKAALTHLGEALYLDLQDSGIGVSVINPGFVETPLTAQNQFTMPALITPAVAAQYILQGWRDGLFEIHFPKRFTLWLQLLRVLPYRWYFSLVRRATGL